MKCLEDNVVYFLVSFQGLKLSIIKFYWKDTLVHAWPEFYESKNMFFTNVSIIWEAPNVSNFDIEFV